MVRIPKVTQADIVAADVSKERTPKALIETLNRLIEHDLRLSLMIWGPPGVGKSSIVQQCARQHGLELIDLRLSQLAPTDLRGLPVPRDGICTWYPPEFLPTAGRGVLFLDEINMATPSMQGLAQQLILDRKVGSYQVPEGWFVWAAGNRKEDRAAVFDMPAPLANRFMHVTVEPDLESFKTHAIESGIDERIIAFLAFRSNLLHAMNSREPAWPSPRSWVMASRLRNAGLPIGSVVGTGAEAEFEAFEAIYRNLPDLDAIVAGDHSASFPDEPSVRYAITIGLVIRATDAARAEQAIEWMGIKAPAEWFQLLAGDILKRARQAGDGGALVRALVRNERLRSVLASFRDILIG